MKQVLHEPLTLAMGRVLAEHVQGRLEKVPDLVVPIPIHWLRRLVRGTNTSEVLVEPVCHRLQVPGALDLLHFRRKVKKQGTLLSGERFRNMRGAFGLSSGYDIREADILLIDDVMTTGATVSEAARVLRKAGAARVTVAVVARGVGPS